MIVGDCIVCVHKEECYPIVYGTDLVLFTVETQFNAICKRDLCVNSGKINWLPKEKH